MRPDLTTQLGNHSIELESYDNNSLLASPTILKTDKIKVYVRPARCFTNPETRLTFAPEVVAYREYGPTINLPAYVFEIGPHTVNDYDCKGSYEEGSWSLSSHSDGVELLSNTGTPQLKISDAASLASFTLTVTGTYSYNGDSFVGTVTQTYKVLSLFTQEYLQISIK